MNRVATTLVVLVLAADAWLAFDVFVGDSELSGSESGSSSPEPSYDDVEIYDDAGSFAGKITIENPLDHDIDVFVDIDLYAGDQHVGEVFGSVSLKPNSESQVELGGVDDFVEYTDLRVHLSGFPT